MKKKIYKTLLYLLTPLAFVLFLIGKIYKLLKEFFGDMSSFAAEIDNNFQKDDGNFSNGRPKDSY